MRLALIQQHATADLAGNLERALDATRRAAAERRRARRVRRTGAHALLSGAAATSDVRSLAEPCRGRRPSLLGARPRARRRDRHEPLRTGWRRHLRLLTGDRSRTAGCSAGRAWCTSPSTRASTSSSTTGRATWARRSSTPRSAASASPSATTAIFRSTCARSRSAAPISSSCRRRAWSTSGRPGFFEGEMCTAAFQNGYFVALCNRVGAEAR